MVKKIHEVINKICTVLFSLMVCASLNYKFAEHRLWSDANNLLTRLTFIFYAKYHLTMERVKVTSQLWPFLIIGSINPIIYALIY